MTVKELAEWRAAAADVQCLQPEIKTIKLGFFKGNLRKLNTYLWEY